MNKPVPSLVAAAVMLASLLGYVGYVVTRHDEARVTVSGTPTPHAYGSASSPPSASPAPPPPPSVFPPSGTVFLGIQTNGGPYDFSPLDAFTAGTGYRPSVMQFTQGWAADTFHAENFDRIAARGMLPIVSWEPWDYSAVGSAHTSGDQPAYRLSRIAGGAFDAYIRSWADGIKALGYPVGIRFAHEMNGFWYPWCESANGNRPGDYVKAFRHVHDIFTAAGATNAIWLWSPNVTYPGAKPLARLYPGDKYVDWVGLSGYYGTAGRTSYQSFNTIFSGTLKQLAGVTKRPVVITETGATNANGQQAQWIRQMFQELPRHPEIVGVIWFEVTKEIDWRLAGNPASMRAYAAGARAKRYAVTWTTNTVPRRSRTR